MRKWILLMPAILTLGCAVELTKDGTAVQIVNDSSNCKFLGTVKNGSIRGRQQTAQYRRRHERFANNASECGANALKINDVDTTPQGTTTLGEALVCSSQ